MVSSQSAACDTCRVVGHSHSGHSQHLKSSVEAQTGRASALLIATLLGGVLVLLSLIHI